MTELKGPTFLAGWYPDPRVAGRHRYFDGTDWTHYTAGMAPPTIPGSTTAPSKHRVLIPVGFLMLAALSVVGTLIFGVLIFEQADARAGAEMAVLLGGSWLLWGGIWTVIWFVLAIRHVIRGRRK